MVILILQSTVSILLDIQNTALDTALRSYPISILGYFMSSQFLKNNNAIKIVEDQHIKILQVLIVGIISIVTLMILIVTKFYNMSNDSTILYLSQYRDLFSGCFGFLIGSNIGER